MKIQDISIRYALDSDFDALSKLIGDCFAEYEGVFLDLENLDADLFALRSAYDAEGGEIWVAEKGDEMVGCIGYTPITTDECELKRLYVPATMRGTGLALRLVALVEQAVGGRGCTRISLWSDTRFTRAHRFYEREGYVRQRETRDLHDISGTTEYQFIKILP